jgi:hypothetical protein
LILASVVARKEIRNRKEEKGKEEHKTEKEIHPLRKEK